MKKILIFTLLVLLVTLNSTSALAFSFDFDTDFEEPQMLLGGCPPGVPCDDQGGGTGGTGSVDPSGATYVQRGAENLSFRYWSPNVTFENLLYYPYSDKVIKGSNVLYMPFGNTVTSDECTDLNGRYGRRSEQVDRNVNPGNTTNYKNGSNMFYYNDYIYEYSTLHGGSHNYSPMISTCQEYDVIESEYDINSSNIVTLKYEEHFNLGLDTKETIRILVPMSNVSDLVVNKQFSESYKQVFMLGISGGVKIKAILKTVGKNVGKVSLMSAIFFADATVAQMLENGFVGDYNELLTIYKTSVTDENNVIDHSLVDFGYLYVEITRTTRVSDLTFVPKVDYVMSYTNDPSIALSYTGEQGYEVLPYSKVNVAASAANIETSFGEADNYLESTFNYIYNIFTN